MKLIEIIEINLFCLLLLISMSNIQPKYPNTIEMLDSMLIMGELCGADFGLRKHLMDHPEERAKLNKALAKLEEDLYEKYKEKKIDPSLQLLMMLAESVIKKHNENK